MATVNDLYYAWLRNQLGLPNTVQSVNELEALFYANPIYGIANNRRFTSGLFYPPSCPGPSVAAGILGLNNLVVVPFEVGQATTFDRISVGVTVVGGAGSVIRLAIYNSTAGLVPNALLDGSGAIVTDVGTGEKSFIINRQLTPGVYWLGIVAQVASPTIRQLQSSWSEYMASATSDQGQSVVGYFQGGVSGALPAIFNFVSTNIHPGACPLVMLRAA